MHHTSMHNIIIQDGIRLCPLNNNIIDGSLYVFTHTIINIITQDTVLSSISAGVLFSLAVGVATVIDAHATWFQRNYSYSSNYGYRSDNDYDYSSMYPITEPGKAAAVSMLMQ